MALTKVSGSIIKDSVSLSGNVSVGGTLTYQDVTNVDALGIGTFRTGIKVLAGQVDVGSNIKLGNAGVITATSFVGSGANLTGITGTTINNNAANKVIMGSNTANTLEAVAKSTLFGNLNHGQNFLDDNYLIFGDASDLQLVHQSSGAKSRLRNTNDSGSLDIESTLTRFTNKDGSTEKLRISSTGYVGLGTLGHTSPTAPLSVNLGQAATNGNYFLDVKGSSTKQFGLYYDQGSWGSAEFGIHEFDDSGNASKRFTIANGGKIGINNDNPDDTLDVNGTVQFTSNTYVGGDIYMYGNSYTGKGIFLGGSHADNRLDYYKTGTWTPEVIDANGSNYSITYTANETRWVRIGNLVYCYYNIRNQEGGSKTGDLRLRGWPFTCKGFQVNGAFWVDHSSPSAGLGDIVGGTHYINRSSGHNVVYWVKPTDKSGSGQASTRYLAHGQWTNGRWIYGSFVYEISD